MTRLGNHLLESFEILLLSTADLGEKNIDWMREKDFHVTKPL